MSNHTYLREYPITELRTARAAFIAGWHRAMRFDRVLHTMYNRHYRFPPLLRMKNCITYPFTKEDQIINMPPLPPKAAAEHKRLDDNSYVSVSTQCTRLTESILRNPDTNTSSSSSSSLSIGHVYYECDVCSFTSPECDQTHAHLKSAQHTSASLFGLIQEPMVVEGDTHSADLDANVNVANQPVLVRARELYNAAVPSLGWLTEKVAIVCPSCQLIFPDKLMCAYHHQSQHDGHQAKHSTGAILAVRRITITPTGKCSDCAATFNTVSDYTTHWLSSRSTKAVCCPSPFLPVRLKQPTDHVPNQLVQAYCQTCRVAFARVTPTVPPSSSHQLKRKRRWNESSNNKVQNRLDDKATDDSIESWSDGFARFMVNHAQLHIHDSRLSDAVTCTLHIRFIRLDRQRQTQLYPPYRHMTDEDLLLFCIHECKRLLTHLNSLRMTRRVAKRRTKADLNCLLELAQKIDTNLS